MPHFFARKETGRKADCEQRAKGYAVPVFCEQPSRNSPSGTSLINQLYGSTQVGKLLTTFVKQYPPCYGLSCSFAYNGNSGFCFKLFMLLQNPPASAHSRSPTLIIRYVKLGTSF